MPPTSRAPMTDGIPPSAASAAVANGPLICDDGVATLNHCSTLGQLLNLVSLVSSSVAPYHVLTWRLWLPPSRAFGRPGADAGAESTVREHDRSGPRFPGFGTGVSWR
jgi:hypothetical protein